MNYIAYTIHTRTTVSTVVNQMTMAPGCMLVTLGDAIERCGYSTMRIHSSRVTFTQSNIVVLGEKWLGAAIDSLNRRLHEDRHNI